ncbi:hypothetical protein N7463_009157 [Penicillium fimorum]|uniref:Rhodopsin domain-containing protein n=1 Tax=Penicillium fimorum TaxID=1882269 RepID=A0A9X0C4F1_9EURO|nr:hypothetical protein N7463_009157 [Penicillium fimorum]
MHSWIVLGLSVLIIHYGSDQHLTALMNDPETLVHMYKWIVGAHTVSGITLYARPNQMPRFLLYLRISFAFVTVVYMAQTLIIALRCVRLTALWSAEGKFMGSVVVFIPIYSLNISCNLLVLLLPMNIIFSLKAKLARKLALALVLCVGVFAAIIALSLPALRAWLGGLEQKLIDDGS